MTGQATARRQYPFALAVLCTILFLTFLDNTIVSVALGSVWTDFKASVSQLQWVVGAYALTFASAMLAFGMVGDEFGRKKVMLSGAAVFCAGSVLSALAPNAGVLIAGRAVMGLGAAASEPGTLSMIRQLYTSERVRARAIAVWTSVSALALAFGPVIGGLLIGIWSWRAVFWFNLLFGAVALIAAVTALPENSDPSAQRVDVSGTVLGAACLTALSFAIITAETSGFGAPVVIVLLIVAAVAAVAFVWQERRARHPLLDLKYLRVPAFLTANVVAFCAYFATFAVFFFSALYLAEVVGYGGFKIAGVYLPMTAMMIIGALFAGRRTTMEAARWLILVGCLTFGAGLLLNTLTITPHPEYVALTLTLALTGFGIGLTLVPVTSSALSSVPAERSGMAASATNTSREIGAVTGVSILGSLVISRLIANLDVSMKHLGIPPAFQSLAIHLVLTGGIAGGANQVGGAAIGEGKLVEEMTQAAYNAFGAGLHAALYLSAFLVLAAGLFTFVVLGRGQGDGAPGLVTDGMPPAPGAEGEASSSSARRGRWLPWDSGQPDWDTRPEPPAPPSAAWNTGPEPPRAAPPGWAAPEGPPDPRHQRWEAAPGAGEETWDTGPIAPGEQGPWLTGP